MSATRMHDSIARQAVLYMALELSQSTWKLGFATGLGQEARQRDIPAIAMARLEQEMAAAKERFNLPPEAPVVSCYEAGRDGFWLHRCLLSLGVANEVVDSSSIEVDRRQRRAKTDRIDVLMLVRALIAIDRGDRHVCAIVNVPSIEEEDARRSHRERQRLIRERTAHTTGSRAFSSRKAFAASRRVDANVSISRSCAPAKGIRWQIGFGPNSNANMPGLIS